MGILPGSLSDLRERLISSGGCGYKRRDSTTISRKYLIAWKYDIASRSITGHAKEILKFSAPKLIGNL